MTIDRRRPLSFLLLPWLLATLPVAGQEAPGNVFVDRVDVDLVNLEVFVTDSQGERVDGLERDDFEIWVDGKQVEITNFFSEIVERPPAAVTADPAPADEGAAASTTATPAATPPDDSRRLNLVVYVDHLNIHPTNRQKVLEQLDEFLPTRVSAGDRVMLVGHERGLTIEQPLTDQPELIAAGLERLRQATAGGSQKGMGKRILRRRISQAFLDGDAAQARSFLDQYKQQVRNELQQSVQGLESMLRALAAVPGRKALLYVSDGLEQQPGADMEEQFFGGAGLRDTGGDIFQRIGHTANAAQITFYTLDARGATGAGASAELSDNQLGGAGRTTIDAIRNENLREPLIGMAEPTGGKAFLGSGNVAGALETLSEDFGSFYSLGYQATEEGRGQVVRVEVRLKQPGLKARHRSSYVAKPPTDRVADRTLSSLLLERYENPLGISLTFAPAEKKRGHYLLPVKVNIPGAGPTFLPTETTAEARLRIFVAVQDADGAVSAVRDQPYPVSVAIDELDQTQAGTLTFETVLQTREGEQVVAFSVWDELSGAESYARETLLIGKPGRKKKR